MTLDQWAALFNVSPVAMRALQDILAPAEPETQGDAGAFEASVQARTRVAVSRLGWRVWRNNIGAGKLENGQFLRWGLANDSHSLNASMKSGDLIGIRPLRVTPDMAGRTIGQFVSLECKREGWQFTGTPRELAQQKWAQLVIGLGGHARFVADERGLT